MKTSHEKGARRTRQRASLRERTFPLEAGPPLLAMVRLWGQRGRRFRGEHGVVHFLRGGGQKNKIMKGDGGRRTHTQKSLYHCQNGVTDAQ